MIEGVGAHFEAGRFFMPSLRSSVVCALIIFGGVLVFSGGRLSGQGSEKGDKVRFTTVDGVEIQGTFFQAPRAKSPAVLLLHNMGEDSRKKVWVNLAEELQKNNFSVLTFDFRGHGLSKTVDPTEFWKYPINRSLVKGGDRKGTEIDFQNMKPAYYPVMVNDIAAARAFLEARNDANDCNVSSLILVGAESGATLGALWLNSEWTRFQQDTFFPHAIYKNPEGKDVIAAIWLTGSGKLGSRTLSLAQLLDVPARVGKTPIVFFYGDGDSNGKKLAQACEKAIKGTKKDDFKYTAAVEIKGSKLTGSALLQKSLGTDTAIIDYLKDVVEAKGNAFALREFRKNYYIWKLAGNFQPAKDFPNERLLKFDTYEKFLTK